MIALNESRLDLNDIVGFLREPPPSLAALLEALPYPLPTLGGMVDSKRNLI